MPVMAQSCADSWGDVVAQITDRVRHALVPGRFPQPRHRRVSRVDSARRYGEAETARVLQKLHTRAFADWLSLNLDQQTRDAARYLASTEGAAAKLDGDFRELVGLLAPAGARARRGPAFLAIPRRDSGYAVASEARRRRRNPNPSPSRRASSVSRKRLSAATRSI